MAFNSTNNEPRLIIVDDANGLTRATVTGWNKADVESNFFKETGMDKIIASTKEARMAGVPERALTDLLLSRHVSLPENKGAANASVIQPFSLVPRGNIVNANFFQIEAGAAVPANGKYWNVTVNVGSSAWVASPSSGLKSIEKFFLPGQYVKVEYKDSSEVSRRLSCKVIATANANGGSTEKAVLTLEPNKSDAGWAALSAAEKAVFQPTAGQVTRMANSVSDYESYGYVTPGTNNLGLITYWRQTCRRVHSWNDQMLAAMDATNTSDGLKKFRLLPLAKLRKQQEMQAEKEMMETVFFGDVIDENQTDTNWPLLPQVVDVADNAMTIEYKSNTIGIFNQLGSRVNDRQNTALDLDSIFESCYTLKRTREATSGSIQVVDAMTDRFTAARIRDLLISKYYKTKFGMDTTSYFQPGQKITFNGQTVLEYNLYDLPDQGVQLAIFTDPYFDDRLASFHQNQKSRGRALWFLDWTDIDINVIKTNTAKRITNVNDALYMNVITPVMRNTLLMSKTFEVRVGDVNRHLVIENFSDETPKLTVAGVDLS